MCLQLKPTGQVQSPSIWTDLPYVMIAMFCSYSRDLVPVTVLYTSVPSSDISTLTTPLSARTKAPL